MKGGVTGYQATNSKEPHLNLERGRKQRGERSHASSIHIIGRQGEENV